MQTSLKCTAKFDEISAKEKVVEEKILLKSKQDALFEERQSNKKPIMTFQDKKNEYLRDRAEREKTKDTRKLENSRKNE